jgi:hypothetical protein
VAGVKFPLSMTMGMEQIGATDSMPGAAAERGALSLAPFA